MSTDIIPLGPDLLNKPWGFAAAYQHGAESEHQSKILTKRRSLLTHGSVPPGTHPRIEAVSGKFAHVLYMGSWRTQRVKKSEEGSLCKLDMHR